MPAAPYKALSHDDEVADISTNGAPGMTSASPPAATTSGPNIPTSKPLCLRTGERAATVKLAAVFWLAVLLIDSVLWGIAGIDPFESAPGKLVGIALGLGLSVTITAILIRFRGSSILTKTALAFALAAVASPIYALGDFEILRWQASSFVPPFDLRYFGYTMVSCMATLFGWACLYIALSYSFDVRDRERKLAAAREEALSAQMRALRYQVNPHFLFNTLNSIAGLIEEGAADRAERMVLSLSTFLRTTLELDPLRDVTLIEEMALQRDYLEIERERFSDRMRFTIDCPDATGSALVPGLILQPLIENAVKHGVGRSADPVEVRITARREADRLVLAVENGLGFDHAPAVGFGIGLSNVAQRITARFGEDGMFRAGHSPGGQYRAEIEIPWRSA